VIAFTQGNPTRKTVTGLVVLRTTVSGHGVNE
jgi:hypothetical protein